MKFTTWCVGVFVILLGLELRAAGSSGWTAVWISAAVFWFFVGAALTSAVIVRAALSKAGKGVLGRAGNLMPARPPEKQED